MARQETWCAFFLVFQQSNYEDTIMYKTIWQTMFLLVMFSSVALAAKHEPQSLIPLKNIELRAFSTVPDVPLEEVTPAFAEQPFALSAAQNFAAVEKRLGGLSDAQKSYLEKHRFVLIPKKEALDIFPDSAWHDLFDEMLSNFDGIGGPDDPLDRQPEHAVLINPDVFLQALHTYFSQKLKSLEQDELRPALQTLITTLLANAQALHDASGNEGAKQWQRLQTYLAISLALLENCTEASVDFGESGPIIAADNSDTLDNALKLFARYSAELTPELVTAGETELERIYAASGMHDSALGLVPAYQSPVIDYTQFKARGHYESRSTLRAYFRAMIWLGQVGWDLQSAEGLADSVNFAVAMSCDNPDSAHREAWQRIMEISSFFVGYPDAPSYPQWQEFLTTHAPGGLSVLSCTDAALLETLRTHVNQIPRAKTPFSALQPEESLPVLTILPQRFTIPWLIGEQLTYEEVQRPDLPPVFSSLWVPATMGSSYAFSLLHKQIALCLASQPSATLEGAPADKSILTDYQSPLEPLQSAAALRKAMATLKVRLDAESLEHWFSSIGAIWFHLLGTLTADYGQGYPLYMQSEAFAAKQLETFMGSYTALKHDTILYEKPQYAEMGGGGDEGEMPPIVKGFVEPNLPFWHALLNVTSYIEEGFRYFSLYPNDLEEYGALGRFKTSLELCLTLAKKELRGQPISDEEYEEIRALSLQYMAEPGAGQVITRDEALSALIVDVQTANLNDRTGAPALIVYEALAAPYIMLALVGNEDSPRVVTGVAYNHQEFATLFGERLTDSVWKKRVYEEPKEEWGNYGLENAKPLPPKNFWYDKLQP